MKRSMQWLGMGLIATAALGMQARAWAADDAGAGQAGGKRGGRMAQELGLSEDQAAKFKDAQMKNREAMKPLQEKLQAALEKLGEQLKAKASDSEISSTLGTVDEARKAVEAQRASHEAALKQILSPTQQAKIVLFMARQMSQALQGMEGGGGGQGSGGGQGAGAQGPGGQGGGPPRGGDGY